MARITVREALYQSLAERLTARLSLVTGFSPPVPVERNRRSNLNEGEAPRLVLRDGAQQPVFSGTGEDLFQIEAMLEGYVDGDDATIGEAISDLYGLASQVLFDGEGMMLIATLDGTPVQVFPIEGRMEIDVLTVTQSEGVMGSFYLDLTVDVRVPSGTRFLETA